MAGKIRPVCDESCEEAGRKRNNDASLAEQVRRTCPAPPSAGPANGIVSSQPQLPNKQPTVRALKHPRESYCEAQQSTTRLQGSAASATARPAQKKTRHTTKAKPNKRVSIQMPSSSAPPPTAKASNLTRIVKPDKTGSSSIHSQAPVAPDSSASALPLVDVPNPLDTDVLCGRGGAALRHPGNTAYRRLVTLNKGLYATCLKAEKLRISRSIVVAVREQNGRFLERDPKKGTWFDIGDRKATEKTSQALREGQPSLRKKIVELGGEAARALGSSTRDLGASAKASATKAAIKVKKECSPSVTDRKRTPSSAKPVGTKVKAAPDKLNAQRTGSDGNLSASLKEHSHPAPAAPLHPSGPPEPSCTAAHDQHQPHVVHANKVHLHAEQHIERTVAVPPPSAALPDSASFDLPQPGQPVRQRSFTLQSLVCPSSLGSDENSGLHHANHPSSWHDSVNSITSEATQLQGNLTSHGGCGRGHGHGGHHNSSFDDSLSSLGGKLEPGSFRNLAPPSLETIHSIGTVEHEPDHGGMGNSTSAEEGPLQRRSMTESDCSGAGDIAAAAVAAYNAAANQGQPKMVPPSDAAWVQQPRQQQGRLSIRTRLRPSIHVRGSAAAQDLGIDDRHFSIASGFSDYGMEEFTCEDNAGGESSRSLALTDASGITAESGGADTSESGTIGDGMGASSGAATPTSGWDEASERTGESSSQSSGKGKGTPPMPRAITADGKPLKTAMKVDRRGMFASMKVTHGPAPSRRSASASNLVANHDRNNSVLSKDDNYDMGKFQMVQSNQSLHSTFSSMRDLSISDSRAGGGDMENDSIAKNSQDNSSLRSVYASKRSLMSGFSRMSDVTEAQSIFSDLSKKIGNVSTRSIAMSDFSGIDENDHANVDDDLSGLTPAHSQSMECE